MLPWIISCAADEFYAQKDYTKLPWRQRKIIHIALLIKKIIMTDFSPSGINHITIRVNDIERAEEFYGDILGFDLVRKMGKSMAVYRVGEEDTLVLVEAETSYDPSSRDYRVDHFGFFLESEEKVDNMAEYLRKKEVTVLSGPANRKRGRFVFASDPDGNMIEFFYEENED